jgi:hypothetical protein
MMKQKRDVLHILLSSTHLDHSMRTYEIHSKRILHRRLTNIPKWSKKHSSSCTEPTSQVTSIYQVLSWRMWYYLTASQQYAFSVTRILLWISQEQANHSDCIAMEDQWSYQRLPVWRTMTNQYGGIPPRQSPTYLPWRMLFGSIDIELPMRVTNCPSSCIEKN